MVSFRLLQKEVYSHELIGGVYVPMLTSYLVEHIQSGDIQGLNLVGMAVGNGELNSIIGSNSLMSDMYYHGYIGKGYADCYY